MHGRTVLVAIAAFVATLTACAGSHEQGAAERATPTADKASSKSPDCGPNSTLSQSDWIDQCSSNSAVPTTDKPNTELAVGDTFAYKDGMKVQVNGINKITRYGEYGDKPSADKTAFRVVWTVTNGTTKPYDLDDMSSDAKGATNGGETESIYVEVDSKEMTGRLAPGRGGRFTSEYTIAKSDGTQIVFTMSRTDDAFLQDDSAYLGEDPHWTGTIK
ncbi:hypothetical protein OH768_39775 [Streptomyces sp. NBC_01622]|uniref:hypothetical protein n=1 Tax=Streptomyces sp. NBC_01622 TaxID=2975903 RepID=UPI00386377FF|nr:hypothetical protein OH768_39775 [Streptomyces sp. NBC_01622]